MSKSTLKIGALYPKCTKIQLIFNSELIIYILIYLNKNMGQVSSMVDDLKKIVENDKEIARRKKVAEIRKRQNS